MSGLPRSYLLRGTETKFLFKRALESRLPNALLYRDKMGFSIPLADWFRGPLRQRLNHALLGPTLQQCGMFNMDVIAELIAQHHSGRRDYSAPLWSLLMFEAFLRKVLHQSQEQWERAA
jgi:asparagine synthase (glutamine-hydrolysing)